MKGFAVKLIMLLTVLTAGALIGVTAAYSAKVKPYALTPDNSETNYTTSKSSDVKPLRVLVCGIDDTQQLTDVILYGLFDAKAKKAAVLQIPRDCFVGDEYPTGKINAVYANPVNHSEEQGIKELETVLLHQFGIPVDYYASVTLQGFRRIVDTVGGVTMDVPETIQYLSGKTVWQGRQLLNGEQAEWLVRYRSGYAQGDIGRIGMQADFLKAAIETIRSKGLTGAVQLMKECYNEISTDMPLSQMILYAANLYLLDEEDISFYTVPGTGMMNRSYAVYQVDAAALQQLLNEHFKDESMTEDYRLNIRQVPKQPQIKHDETEDITENNIWQEFLNSLPEQGEQTERSEQTEPIDIEPFWDEQFTQPELKEGNE